MIDTQAPLVLQSSKHRYAERMIAVITDDLTRSLSDERVLLLDLLSVHLIRKKHGSVIVSYHPESDIPTTKAPYLHERIRFAGESSLHCI